jgi:hypothetical protein
MEDNSFKVTAQLNSDA